MLSVSVIVDDFAVRLAGKYQIKLYQIKSYQMKMYAVLVLCLMLGNLGMIMGHGMMLEPVARNSMWRKGFPNPHNYNDNEQNCGGFSTQWSKNQGKCGICGDAAHLTNQPHNDGGKYSNGVIAKEYKEGQVIDIEVKLTSNHQGYFEFRIGEYDNKNIEGDMMGKLKGDLLRLTTGTTRYNLPRGSGNGMFRMKAHLPKNLLCKRCVIQWWYSAGNNWGCDGDGCGTGHGKQEHFVNCADVKIVP